MSRLAWLFAALLVSAVPAAVFAASFQGTDGRDTIRGTAGPDTINGKGGNDRLYGLGGGDRIIGGGGNDIVFAGAGNDRINVRDTKQDTVSCGSGRDRVEVDRKDRVDLDCERVRGPRPKPSVPPPTTPVLPAYPAASDAYNGGDLLLPNRTTAQQYLDRYPSDPSHLDGDGDGRAGE